MAAIHFVERTGAGRVGPGTRSLARAATDALRAPSIFNSQPWRWRISGASADLRADRSRQVTAVDPDGRLLIMSCGAALHHARIALAAAGFAATVSLLPDPTDPDLLATISLGEATTPELDALRLYRSMSLRHTDRRPFAETPVPSDALDRLGEAAESAGAHLHLPRPQSVVSLTVAAEHAAAVERNDRAYRAALATWVDRPAADGDGVPADTAPQPAARPVAMRDFTQTEPTGPTGAGRAAVCEPHPLADRFARYVVLFTDGDGPRDWLLAGAGLSAVLLEAAADGLAASPMSDLVEVPAARLLLSDLLGHVGYPAMAVRVGMPAPAARATVATPRRQADDVVEVV
jgi:hypothetical protein